MTHREPPITDEELAVLTAPPPPPVPQVVTRFQALAALHLGGYLPTVEAIMAAPETPILTKLAWNNALNFERNSATVASLAGVLNLSDAALDALFTTAAGIGA